MQNIIIGTAGHIDHGKTTLIKALTGRETDRLKEEKERGISIELGFTYFDLPSGRRAGIIDVPGHEKFIKNMLAGIRGIDMVLLVIAADEGIMPQTREHLNILSLLEIDKGLIGITKSDMVDDEWLEMVKEEIKDSVKDTFLKNAPIIPVSSTKGTGLDQMIQTIDELTTNVDERGTGKPVRLPIDRVFSITGFGTVITGTLLEGQIKEGDTLALYPQSTEVKVRNIQVHDQNVPLASAGQRVAINISNIKREEVKRGDILGEINTLQSSMMLDCKIKVLPDSPFPIRNRERVRIYLGTSEILGRIVLLDEEELMPGEEGYAQLRLEDYAVSKPMDHFIIRFYSPMVTIGGGIVLDAQPPKRKRFKEETIKELQLKEKGDPKEILLQVLKTQGKNLQTLEEIQTKTGFALEELEKNYKLLLEEKSIIDFSLGKEIYLIPTDTLQEMGNQIKSYLEDFHREAPLKPGAPKEEIRSKYFKDIKTKLVEEIVGYLEEIGDIKIHQETIALSNFVIELTVKQKEITQEIQEIFQRSTFKPPSPKEIIDNRKDSREYRQVFYALVQWGKIIKLNEELYLHKEAYDVAIDKLKGYCENNKKIDVAAFRDLLETNRKIALALLEDFDEKKITKRVGNERTLYKK